MIKDILNIEELQSLFSEIVAEGEAPMTGEMEFLMNSEGMQTVIHHLFRNLPPNLRPSPPVVASLLFTGYRIGRRAAAKDILGDLK